MRFKQPAIILTVSMLMAAMAVAGCGAAVVTVDVGSQTAKSEDDKLDAKWIKSRNQQVGVVIQNTTLAPRDFVARFTGLKDQRYDVYLNGQYAGARDAKELDAGLPLTANGTIADPDMMRCLNAAKPTIDTAYIRLSKYSTGEPQRVAATLSQAAEWARSGIKTEQVFRSVKVVLTPSGRVLEIMSGPTWLSDIDTARGITRACWLLQQARARMSRVINDPYLRDEAVAAMTPVEFTTSYSVRNGKPHIGAVITNNCNLPISGKITAAAPRGWKWAAKNAAFTDLKCGKTLKFSFDLVPATKTAAKRGARSSKPDTKAATPFILSLSKDILSLSKDGVKIAAAIKLVQDEFEANYTIKTIARPPSPEPVSKPDETKPPAAVPSPSAVTPPKETK